jgi:hypothetical protein
MSTDTGEEKEEMRRRHTVVRRGIEMQNMRIKGLQSHSMR